MSGKILKTDVISENVAKEIANVVLELNKLLESVKDLKKTASGGAGINDVGNASKEAKRYLAEMADVAKRIAKFQKQQLGEMADVAKRIANEEKKKVTDKKKNVNEWIAAAKRVAAFEKKDASERIAAYKRVAAEQKKKSTIIAAEQKKESTAIKLKIAAQKAEKGSVDQLNKVNAILKNRIKGLNATIPEENKRVEKLTSAIERNNQKKKTLNKTNSGLITSFKNIVKSIGAYVVAMVGIQQVIRFFTNTLFNMTKKLDSLRFSMKTVIKGVKEFGATTLFLNKTAVNYGLNLLSLTERYIKFRAASMQSNMTARATMRIFDSTAKAAAVLGLKTDEVSGVFLALEQMISKGKVTTEELRRQLGERLPGAFGIMADAIGVSIIQLDKMLKSGEVLSAQALPKFAVALEKAYGIESLLKVKNLAAEQGRLKTSWVQFVDAISASKAYSIVLEQLTRQIKKLKYVLSTPSIEDDPSAYFDMINSGISKTASTLRKFLTPSPFAPMLYFFNFFEKGANDFQKLIQEMAEAEKKGTAKSKEYFIERVKNIGYSLNEAETLWKEYAVRVGLIIEEEKSKVTAPFNFNDYKKDLDRTEKDTQSYANQTSKELKSVILANNDYLSNSITTYKQVLKAQESDLIIKQKAAKLSAENAKKGRDTFASSLDEVKTLNAAQKLSYDTLNEAYNKSSNEFIELTEARIEVANRLADIETKKGSKDNKDPFFDPSAAIELQRKLQDAYDAGYTKRLSLARGNAEETINIEREMTLNSLQNDELTLNQKQQLYAKLRELDDKYNKEASDEYIASLYEELDKENIARSAKFAKDVANTRRNTKGRLRAETSYSIDLLSNDARVQQSILDSALTTADEKAKAAEKLAQLEISLNEKVGESDAKLSDLKKKQVRDLGEAVNQSFEFANAIGDRQLSVAKERYDADMAAAGNNLEMKYRAEQAYEEKQKKIKTRQAIADKAQALFNIGLQLALGTAKLNAFQIAAALLATATVLATPIPAFEKGGEHEGGLAKVSEKGYELFVGADNKSFLTPKSESVLNLPPGIIIPHDETQSILANTAIKQSYDIIDMSKTNTHLKNIDKNTKRNKEVFEINGKLAMKRGNVTSILR